MSINDEIEESLEEILGKIKEQRDELSLKSHLAGMEMREEWNELEKKWDKFKSRVEQAQKEVEPSVGEINSALALLGEELKKGYKKLRKSI